MNHPVALLMNLGWKRIRKRCGLGCLRSRTTNLVVLFEIGELELMPPQARIRNTVLSEKKENARSIN